MPELMIDILTCFTSVKTPVKSIAFVPLFPYWKKKQNQNPLGAAGSQLVQTMWHA